MGPRLHASHCSLPLRGGRRVGRGGPGGYQRGHPLSWSCRRLTHVPPHTLSSTGFLAGQTKHGLGQRQGRDGEAIISVLACAYSLGLFENEIVYVMISFHVI